MFYPGIEEYRVRVELTESGFADRMATATYGTVSRIPSGIRDTDNAQLRSSCPRSGFMSGYPLPDMKAQAAETGIEPISPESESGVIPLHYSAKADAERNWRLENSPVDCF